MKEQFTPKIVGFLCNWCSYAGADLAGAAKLEIMPSLTVIRVMCSSRIDPNLVLTTLLLGADGILIAGCHPGDCHYHEGNYHTRRRFVMLIKIFDTLGLDSKRLKLSWISASEGTKFAKVSNEYTEEIKSYGENPSKWNVFL